MGTAEVAGRSDGGGRGGKMPWMIGGHGLIYWPFVPASEGYVCMFLDSFMCHFVCFQHMP